MLGVVEGFTVVIAVIAVGYALARAGALGGGGRRALASMVYLVATPALLFDQLTGTPAEQVFSAHFVVIVASALGVGIVFFLLCRYVLRDSVPEAIIGMLASSYANGGNLGIPLAAYLLGDATVVVPMMLFQIAFYAPITLTALDIAKQRGRGSRWRNVAVALKNPMLLASLAGIAVTVSGVSVPAVVAEPVSILAGASVPLALVVFGMSLYGATVRVDREVALAALFKNVLHPAVAGLLAWGVFGMTGTALHAAITVGALPTAQNVYTYAVRFRTREEFARDTGVVTTLASLPVLLVVALFFA